ncbi:TlyA family RNA methyltransferase [Ligaoa zhengdingensis]|uniref:TlyA family RNA methyltransferase n=1 Tax=Ligaoa zhengdingensis TaxID=2763658 RepID=UPI0031BA391F
MKKRLDLAVTELGLTESREKAKTMIMLGRVYVNNQKADKPGMTVSDADQIELRGETLRYVSRGGLKLEKSIPRYGLNLEGAVCMDIGASTGGFTDCMLQNGASKVYSIDVGYGQLAWKLRCDERVVNLERTNFRYVTQKEVPDPIDFASVDVSFISLTLILPVAINLLRPGGEMVCLVKPQFEAGKGRVGKKGVVREPEIHREVIAKVADFAHSIGFSVLGIDYSPIKGPEGNIEYLLYLKNDGAGAQLVEETAIRAVVEASHQQLE